MAASKTLKNVWKRQAEVFLELANQMSDEAALFFLGGVLRRLDTMKNRGTTVYADLKKPFIDRMVRYGVWELFASRRNFVKIVYRTAALGEGSKGAVKVSELAQVLGSELVKELVSTELTWQEPQPGGMKTIYILDTEAIQKLPVGLQLEVFKVIGYPDLHVSEPPKRAKAGKKRGQRA